MTTQLRDPIDDHELDRRLRATFAAVMPLLDAPRDRGDAVEPSTPGQPGVIELDRSTSSATRRHGRALVAGILASAAAVAAIVVIAQREPAESPAADTVPATVVAAVPGWYDVIRPYLPGGFDQIALMHAADDAVSFRAWRGGTGQILEVTVGLRTGDLKDTTDMPTATDDLGEWFESTSGVALETADGRMITLSCGIVVVNGGGVGDVGMSGSNRDYCGDDFDNLDIDRASRRAMVRAFATTFPTDVRGAAFGTPAPHTTHLIGVEAIVESTLPDVDIQFGSTQWDGVVQFADASPADAVGTTELSVVYGVYPPHSANVIPAFLPGANSDPATRMVTYDDVAFGWMTNDVGTGFHVVTTDLSPAHLTALGTMLEQLAALPASDEPIPDTLPSSSPTSTIAPTATSAVSTGPRLLIANASTFNGAAGALTVEVADDYAMLEATNALVRLDRSIVYFAAGYEDEAARFAELLGGADVAPTPDPLPIEGGNDAFLGSDIVDASTAFDLLVMLGDDHAPEWANDVDRVAVTTTTAG